MIQIPEFNREDGTVKLRFANETEVVTSISEMDDLYKRMKSLSLLEE